MEKGKLSYVFITILGIILLAVFFPLPIFPSLIFSLTGLNTALGSPTVLLIACFFPIVAVVFIVAGLCGLKSRDSYVPPALRESIWKHSRLYRFVAILGFAFLMLFSIFWYLNDHSIAVEAFFRATTPLSGFLMIFVFLFGGTILLTVGVCGFVRPYFNSHRNLLTMLVAISLPSFVIMTVFYVWLSALQIGY